MNAGAPTVTVAGLSNVIDGPTTAKLTALEVPPGLDTVTLIEPAVVNWVGPTVAVSWVALV